MITLTQTNGNSVTINPDRVSYVIAGENDSCTVYLDYPLMLFIRDSYLEVVGQLKAQSGGCCR